MSKAAISVATATYNGERFLQKQLDSLPRQTLLPFELVVCDDGSTDGTLEILDQKAYVADGLSHGLAWKCSPRRECQWANGRSLS